MATAENAYDLLPTIRSRSAIFQLAPLPPDEMEQFVETRQLDNPAKRIAIAAGSPGLAVSLDAEAYDTRRAAMLALLETGAGLAPFARWVKHSESIGARKSEKLEAYLKILYFLLEDLLFLEHGGQPARNPDVGEELGAISARVDFHWIECAVRRVDDLVEQLRRNIQKSIALDALVVELRSAVKGG